MCTPRVTRNASITMFKLLPHTHTHTHTSTWVHWYSSLLQWSVPLGQRGHVGRIRCTVTTDLTHVIFWHKMPSPPERPFFHCIHSHHVAAEMWTTMINNLLGKKCLSCSLYLYRFHKYVLYGFLIINFCNPGVHCEMLCISVIFSVITGYGFRVLGLELFPMFEGKNRS